MHIQELVPLGPKTTMRIGGKARYFAELKTRKDAEEAYAFAKEKNLPLIPLGGGSNTIFADGVIQALVVTVKVNAVEVNGTTVRAEAGLPLATLVAKLAEHDLDLSPLTGIPGTVGGAIFGNAGQGPKGIWIDYFVESVTVLIEGKWQSLSRAECGFGYRKSAFRDLLTTHYSLLTTPIIWEVFLEVPARPKAEIQVEIERLFKKRLESQPHSHTSGSCFKALPDGTPAWKVIDGAGLKGKKVSGVAVSEQHANFLISEKDGTFADAQVLIQTVRKETGQPLELEMRCITENGSVLQ